MKKTHTLLFILLIAGCTPVKQSNEVRAAVALAQRTFQEAQRNHISFDAGPCLSNDLMSDWVADIAHSPRTAVDDSPENQCSAYVNGNAHHFVELDPDGKLLRAH